MWKKTIEDAIKLANKKGGKCLSEKYVNNTIKMKWQCEHGHIWKAPYARIRLKHWCPHCSGNAPKILKNAQLLAKEKGGKCLSKEYTNNSTRMKWKCEHRHVWEATYDSIQQGKWCPHCSNRFPKTIKSAQSLAKEKGGKCLSREYKHNRVKMKWQCKEKHEWETTYANVRQGCWCPHCSGLFLKTIKDAKLLAKEKDGKCLSKEYKNSRTRMKWQCKERHIWQACYGDIQYGTWCPKCKNKTQTKLFNIIKKIFSKNIVHYNYKGFEWLKTKMGKKQEIDVFVPKSQLAIEYDGEQHFKAIRFFGGEEGLKKRKRLDRLKNKKIKNHPEDIRHFIRFNYKEDITEEYVVKKLKKCGVSV